MEWVEIIEPRTKEHMYANLTTGECVWDPPPGVPVKKTDNNQWWELFDHNTSRFYYYNATSQKTVWHRPTDCDIIPLAKLQTLKQNTEPAGGGADGLASGDDPQRMGEYRKKESVSTQTQTPSAVRAAAARFNHQESLNAAATLQVGVAAGRICKPRVASSGVGPADSQTSPSSPSPSPSSRRQHHHHHHHYHHQHNNRHHRYQEEPATRKHHNNSQDSGRSSDSSISHSRTSLESSAAYRLLDSPHRHQQRSSIGQQTPTGGLPPPPPPPTTSNRSVATLVATPGNTMESRSQNRSGTLENAKNVKIAASSTESAPPLGLSLSTSTPLFKKKSFVEQQAGGIICHRERRTQKNGRESSSRGSYGPEPSTSPYRDSSMEPRAFRQEMPPYRPPEVQQQYQSAHGYKTAQSTDKYGSLVESSNRYHRERERERELLHHRDRVNSLDKSANSSSGFYSSSIHGRNLNKSEAPSNVAAAHGDVGSIGRKHRGCSASLSEANVREMYGVMLADKNDPNKSSLARDRANALLGSNVIRQKSLEVSERTRDRDRPTVLDRQQVDTGKTTSASNNSLDATSQPLARSYSFVQQQQQQQHHHHHHHHHHQQSRRRNRDDDSMHERYLIGQTHDPSRLHRLAGGSSNSTSSNSSNSSDSSNSSCNSAIGEDIRGHTGSEDYGKKKPSNGNPSPPPSPYYGNLLVDADHLLPLQHYILEQAKLSGCYKFGDPLFGVEEGDDSLDEESGGRGGYGDESRLGGRVDGGCGGGGIGSRTVGGTTGRPDDDSDDQFADDEAASNQGDSSSQEYLEDHYADLGNYDTAGLATYYNTAETLTRPQITTSVPPMLVSTAVVPIMGVAATAISATTATTTFCTGSSVAAASAASHRAETRGEGSSSLTSPRPISLPPSSAFTSLVMGKGIDTNDAGSGGGDIEKYAQDNLNLNCGRPKGLRLLFRKKFSVRDILSWSKDPIPQPMLVVVDGEKLLKREACNLFRLVQVYMGDRKANVGMTLDGVATDVVNTAFSKPPLRDELYVQICRQTTENPRKESLRRGWELMAVSLAFVPPSATFEPYLEGYMNRHRDPNFQFPEVAKWPIHVQVSHYATVACKRLQRIGAHGKRQPRKATIEDIDQARIQIFRASMFGATLSEVMALQRDRFPDRELPWVQTTLTRQVLVRGGTLTEGIFRVSADADEVSTLKSCLDRFEDGGNLAASQDAHAPASLLKLWVRELYEPLIPDSFYTECVSMRHDDGEASASGVAALVERLADLNRRVLCHLIRFLQIFARPEVVARTKMDANNLAMVMAPNILRCTSQDPRVILENARKEMAFVRTLIESLDTSWVDDLH